MKGVLDGVRVVELGQVLAGPFTRATISGGVPAGA